MLSQPMRRILRSSNIRAESVKFLTLRRKSETTKPGLKAIRLENTHANESRNTQTKKGSFPGGVSDKKGTNLESKGSNNTFCQKKLPERGGTGTGSDATTYSNLRHESLPAECRVLEFDEIPCPSLIKWTSKLLSYIPELSTQVTANLARNGFLPVRHLLNQYGPVVRLSGPLGGPILLVARPELLEAVFAEEGNEPEGIGFDTLRHYRKQKGTETTSLQSAYTSGPFSLAQTRAALAATTARVDPTLLAGLEKTADHFVSTIRTTRTPQGEVNVESALRQWAFESAIQAAFGQSLQEALNDVDTDVQLTHSAFVTASDALRTCETGLQLWRWFMTPSWAKLESSLDQLYQILGKHVWAEHGKLQREGAASEQPKCVLDALLRIGLHPDAVISAIVELVLVAGNTTSCAAGMLLYELSRHPRYQRTVLEEIRQDLPSSRAKFEAGLPKLTFLHACIKETLRLHPPVPTLSRVLPKAARLHQYHVPQGTVVVLATAHCGRREDQFEDAERFRPHRWLEEDPGRHPLAGLPWGGGARACPAASIAAAQVALLAAKTVRAFQIEHEYGTVQLTGEVLARPSRPLRLRFVERTT